mmetsp:Transcript_5561/g.8124  ORF Transcript_5561/g.8124 Transcript_5561/m.8124 type:complete len:265 (+) Transcript_5561:95-889(+)
MSLSPSSSRHPMNNDKEEETWIEANWLCSEGGKEQDENEEGLDVFDLFSDPDPYDTFRFTFGSNIALNLKGIKQENGQTLKSTGLTLWRASPALCEYMVPNAEPMKGKKVLELGAGLGLCGLLAYFLGARQVVLTDGDTDVLANMRDNVASNTLNEHKSENTISCHQLRWGKSNHDTEVLATHFGKFDIILASDVIYMEEAIEPLFDTIMELLTMKKNGMVWLSYARRNVGIDAVLSCAQRHGLQWTTPEGTEGVFVLQRYKKT